MKHYIRQKTDNSIQYTRHLIHKPRSIVLSKGHLTRNTFKSNIFMLINKLIVKFYVHGSLGVLQSWYLAYWWVSNCFFHELSYVKSLDFGPTFFVVIFNVICLTINNLSGILDTTDTSFVHPCLTDIHFLLNTVLNALKHEISQKEKFTIITSTFELLISKEWPL